MGSSMASPHKSLKIWVKHFPAYHAEEKHCGPNLGEGLCKFTFFLFPNSGIYLLNGFDFYFN